MKAFLTKNWNKSVTVIVSELLAPEQWIDSQIKKQKVMGQGSINNPLEEEELEDDNISVCSTAKI